MYPYVGEQITSAIRRDLILVELCHEKTEGKEDAGWKDSLVDEIRDAGNDHWPDGARLDSRDMKELVGGELMEIRRRRSTADTLFVLAGEPWYPADFKGSHKLNAELVTVVADLLHSPALCIAQHRSRSSSTQEAPQEAVSRLKGVGVERSRRLRWLGTGEETHAGHVA